MSRFGLRPRIVLALVALAAATCWALTTAITGWAANQREQQLLVKASDAAQLDADAVVAAIEMRPGARTVETLAVDRLDGVDPMEAVLLPVQSRSKPPDLTQAHQYVWVNSDQPLTERIPECLLVGEPSGLDVAGVSRGSTLTWNARCGDYLMGYALTFVGEGGGMDAWMTVTAIPIDTQYYLDLTPDLYATLAIYSLVIVGVALLVATGLARMVTTPVSRAREMAEAVAGGDLSIRVPVQGRDELARLSTAVNAMADRLTNQIVELEHASESQRRFVADVAHELRTPTAALLASAEALENPDTREAAAPLVAPQLRRLATLTEDLLEISRMDAGRAEVVISRVDVMDVIAQVITDTGTEAIAVVGPEHVELTVDAARLRVVVRNLVHNALKHGAPPVVVAVELLGTEATIGVRDSGPGVPAELRDRVFDRFVRGETSRHGSSAGLGLAIAAENARLLGGSLGMSDDGSEFTLRLPIERAAEGAPS
ncbi:MAG TPA: HAMP domain-containing sensor histidine kinase [Propionicimonas sp.]|nr:HAMP domain-containing sensor histidine kinase [Propionicimonas sp.]